LHNHLHKTIPKPQHLLKRRLSHLAFH